MPEIKHVASYMKTQIHITELSYHAYHILPHLKIRIPGLIHIVVFLPDADPNVGISDVFL